MCGIVGASLDQPVLNVLLDGLARLDYRGYDSAGIVLATDATDDGLWLRRRAGRLCELRAAVADAPRASTGIGHTRWATHGAPTERNAHPHFDCSGELAIVHNGIVENWAELADELRESGHAIRSETDTEVIAHLLEREMAFGAKLAEALRTVMGVVEGSLAVACVHRGDPSLIVAARRGSPLVVGRTDTGSFVASDIPAIIGATRELYVLDDNQVVEARRGALDVTDLDGEPVTLAPCEITWDASAVEKGGFDTFMQKEMHEQPSVVATTVRTTPPALGTGVLAPERLRDLRRVVIVACGTSYHAGLVGSYAFEEWAQLGVEVEIASEFHTRRRVYDPQTLVIAVAQSGETIDTLEALRSARRAGAGVLALVNVIDSTIAREADDVVYTLAGPEIGVASTKTHVAQITTLQLLALAAAEARNTLTSSQRFLIARGLHLMPELIEKAVARGDDYAAVARRYAHASDFFFLGRHTGVPVAMEGALKLKELSYARAEAYAAGELKHGPIALIDDASVVVAIATDSRVHAKVMSNVAEVKARGARVIVVANDGDHATAAHADDVLWVPRATDELLMPAVAVVPLQFLAYEVAATRGLDIDKPRNLAKTVTVE